LQNVRFRFLPKNSQREKIARRLYYLTRDLLALGPLRRAVSRAIENTGVFTDRYAPEDFGDTTLFTDQDALFPEYPFRLRISGPRAALQVTLISTLRNEIDNVEQWMERIFHQTRLPDEIILVDGGSSDGTLELLQACAERSPVPIHVVSEPGINIARGRNLAIAQAQHPVIAATDFGCRPEATWLENILAPFERDAQIQMAAGWYVARDAQGNQQKRRAWPTLDQVDPATFIPSSRSIAFTKALWQQAGGYPEWLTLTGEDTYFALELRKFSRHRAFVPDAVVNWFAPTSLRGYWKKVQLWSVGDGESGLHATYYFAVARQILWGGLLLALAMGWLILSAIIHSVFFYFITALFFSGAALLVWRQHGSLKSLIAETGLKIAMVHGYLQGMQRRKEIDLRRFEQVQGVMFILAGVPIHDTGGGSRGAQLALELLRQNYLVVYLNKFSTYESVNLGLHIAHPNLLLYNFTDFSWERFYPRYAEILGSKPCGALVEFPLADFLPLVDRLHQIGVVVAYDLLDDWDTQLGSTWYTVETEKQLISASDVLIATAPVLVERLSHQSSREVAYLPNAVNLRLFDSQRAYLQPGDLPEADKIIAYIGALWGEWFDWDLLLEVARHNPESAVVVIGDYRDQCPAAEPNLHFLGLKPQSALPAYLANSTVAIIPWKVNQITRATSPLKLYEYLAMNVPVVVPDLPPLYGIPAVYLSPTPAEFLANIRIAMQAGVEPEPLQRYIRKHSWEQRVKQLVELLEFSSQDRSKKPRPLDS